MQPQQSKFKLVLLGDASVGKSSLVLRFTKNQFKEFQDSTIGAAFVCQTIIVDDMTIRFDIWDTAGQERYHSLAPMYYREAKAAIVVYDITDRESFERARTWITELNEKANTVKVIALAGNKVDCQSDRKVTLEEATTFADENGLFFLETSAKSGVNVNEIFLGIARKLPIHEPVQARPVVNMSGNYQNDNENSHSMFGKCCK